LITGAGRGIGRATAIALADRRHRLVLTARSEPELAATAALCRTDTVIIPADITADGAVDAIFEAAGGVDILVANAGGAIAAPVVRTTDEDWQRMLDLNLTAPFRCIRRALPHMIEQEWGRIVVIGSVASRQGAPYIAAYVAAKHGVLGLVRATATEVVRSGVTVNAVCPGFVDSPMTDDSVANIVAKTGRTPEQARAGLESRQPINRLITVDEVASAVLFCVDNGAITGQGINVDGGAVQS
jgi:NAD(P)-dependent dehydrogenase (short-subunit alcohol dehydrogenase family)